MGATTACAAPGETRFWVYRSAWDPASSSYGRPRRVDNPPAVCLGAGAAAAVGVDPRLAVEAQVRRQWKSFPIPAAVVRTFPAGQTLAGAVTRVEGSTDRQLVLAPQAVLGFRVTVTVTAARYVWDFGDGATEVASVGSGRPRAEHVYRVAGPMRLSLRAYYTGSFTLAGSARVFPLEGEADVPGQAQALLVREARTQLEAGSG